MYSQKVKGSYGGVDGLPNTLSVNLMTGLAMTFKDQHRTCEAFSFDRPQKWK